LELIHNSVEARTDFLATELVLEYHGVEK